MMRRAALGWRAIRRSLWAIPLFAALLLGAYLNTADASSEDEAARAERALIASIARELTTREGQRRPDEQLTVDVFGRPLIVGGEIELRGRYRGDYRIDPTRADDDFSLVPSIELELFYALTRSISLFVEGRVGYDRDLYSEDAEKDKNWQPRRGESWVHFRDIFESGLALQIGNQNFDDKREWWWDEDLEAIRLIYEFADFEVSLGVAERLASVQLDEKKIEPALEDVFFLLGQATWYWDSRNRIDLFGAYQRDHSGDFAIKEPLLEDREDQFDGRLWWLGLRAQGRVSVPGLGRLFYWADTAMVRGKERIYDFGSLKGFTSFSEVDGFVNQHVRGWAIDIGATWDLGRRYWPRPTLGYAFGSGDSEQNSGRSRSFRQTGLNDNNAKFGGVDSFKYYGELFRPELSNIHIATAALGFSFLSSSSIELIYHAYWQDEAAPSLRNSRLKASPAGREPFLGHEWNVALGIEEWKHWSVELIGGVFWAGEAFGIARGERAFLGELKLEYDF